MRINRDIDYARRAYLLAILCSRDDMVHRTYIEEKINFAFQASSAEELMTGLDLGNQAIMQEILREHAPSI